MTREGVVNTAKANPFPKPTQALPAKAQAEKTTSVWPHGRATVKNPKRKVDHPRSFNIRVEVH